MIVGGPSSHTRIEGNNVHDNNGAGIAFRGDSGSHGRNWRTEHWVVQGNRIANNRFGIWGRWGDAILLAANEFANNAEGNYLTNLTNLIELPAANPHSGLPTAELAGPNRVPVGQLARFDATTSHDPAGRPLRLHWFLGGETRDGPVWEHTFTQPGLYRVNLTVDNGALADLAWRDLLVVDPVAEELGTEGQAGLWGYELENNTDGKGRMIFTDELDGLIGGRCVRFTPNPYPGAYATAIFPGSRNAGWNFSNRKRIHFWIKSRNPNVPGWQNAGPVVRLLGPHGQIELKPPKDGNLLNEPPFSEARWLWMPVSIPLAGDSLWERHLQGEISLDHIDALSISLDSWGGDPFTVWLDGLTVE